MADQKITTFNVTVNIIDENGDTNANKVIDNLVSKINEINGIRVQYAAATLNVKMPSSTAQRHLLDIRSTGEGDQVQLQVIDVPKEHQSPPQYPS